MSYATKDLLVVLSLPTVTLISIPTRAANLVDGMVGDPSKVMTGKAVITVRQP